MPVFQTSRPIPQRLAGHGSPHHYPRLRQYLSDTGRRIPANDIWIAAHAMELSATLVAADRHFDAIPNLPVLLAPPADPPRRRPAKFFPIIGKVP